jgi:hypothetical protein
MQAAKNDTNAISGKHPFAATLLAYALIERAPKPCMVENREDKGVINHERIKAAKKYYRDEKEFINHYIINKILEDAEQLIIGLEPGKYLKDRNDAMHSNLHLKDDAAKSFRERN